MIRRPPGRRLSYAFAVGLLALPTLVSAQYTASPRPSAYAIRNATLVSADGVRQPGVTIIVRGDVVEAAGPRVSIPADAQLLEGDSLYVYPGFVDAHGTAKFEFPKIDADRSKIPSWDAPRTVQGFMPHRRVVDHLLATGSDLADQRKQGVVAAAVHPADAMMPGQGALLLFRPDAATPARLVLDPSLGPVMAFRGARGFYPGTLFGVVATIRQSYMDAARQRQLAGSRVGGATYDPDYAVLQETAAGRAPVFFTANSAIEIRRVLTLAQEIGFRPVIVGGAEAWKLAPELKRANVPVLVSLDFPKPKRWKPEPAKGDTTKAAKGAKKPLDAATRAEKQELEAMYANPGKLAKAGVRFALTSGGGKADLREGVRKAMEHGLTESDALRALTATPATLLGAGHLGRVASGSPATFIVTNDPVFEKDAKIAYAFVEGSLEKGETKKKAETKGAGSGAPTEVGGIWDFTISIEGQDVGGTLELKQDGTSLAGKVTTPMGSAEIKSGSVDGTQVEFAGTTNQGAPVTFTGTLSSDILTGTGSMADNRFTWSAKRSSPSTPEAER